MRGRALIDWLVYVGARIAICIVQALRPETGHRLARGLGWFCARVLRVRGECVEDNLRHAFPESSEAERQALTLRMWEHLFLMAIEVAHAPRKIHETNWRHYVTLRDEKVLMRCLLEHRPTLLVTAHLGNFEVAGYVLGLLGFPNHAIARTLDNPYIDRYVNRFRSATGQYIIPKNGGYDQILQVLNEGGILTFLADQSAGRKGCWVRFFARPASAHKAIALLALENNAPMVVSYARRTSGPLHFEMGTHAVSDPASPGFTDHGVPAMTQWYTDRLEEIVRLAPDQYWWVHRRWKDSRSASQKRRAAA